MALLEIKDLCVRFNTPDGQVTAINGISLKLEKGQTLGIVGESGSGKSQMVLAILGLLAANGKAEGSIRFAGQELIGLAEKGLNQIRGNRIAMIFQDPMTCLNGYLTIARQMTEVLVQHRGMDMTSARKRSLQMLDAVHIPDAANRIDRYPHEFSGGMRQRVMIAMALLCEPELLIADEPTTALDVTVQAQIIDLMNELRRERDMSILMITHDLGIIAGIADRVLVAYAGRLCEYAEVQDLFSNPRHPYTRGLLHSVPRLDEARLNRLASIPGNPPNLSHLPPGCAFAPRCPQAMPICSIEQPGARQVDAVRVNACHLEPVT